MKPSPNQIRLLDTIATEIGWWKHSDISWVHIEDFVKHEVSGLPEEHKNQLTNALTKIMYIVKQVEE